MLAGHTLLYIMSSFVMAFINSGYLILAALPFIIILAVYVLELGIAFIQAYVFIILLVIYLNDALHPSH
jgi:F0F1-type ATP synthase membrane subunit a